MSKNRARNFLRLAAFLTALSRPGIMAAQTGHFDPTQDADGVVVGDVALAQPGSGGAPLTLRVTRVLKGAFVAGEMVPVLWDGPPVKRAVGVLWGDYGLWLLRAAAGGNWSIVRVPGGGRDLTGSCYPIPAGGPPPASALANPSPLDLIVGELSQAVQSFDPKGMEFLLTAESLLRLPATPSLTSSFQKMSEASDYEIEALGLAGRIFQSDTAALSQVVANAAVLRRAHISVHLSGAISMVRDPAPGIVSILGRLATDATVGYGMRAAAEALAKIHTKESLPFLTILLDSQDPILRDYAFDGFTRFVRNLPVEKPEMVASMAWRIPQGPAPYRTPQTDQHLGGYGTPVEQHSELVAFWKSWWAQHQELH